MTALAMYLQIIMVLMLLAIMAGVIIINYLLLKGAKKGEQAMATLAELEVQVSETLGIEQSTMVFIQGLKDQLQALIDAGNTNPAAIQNLIDQLDASEKALAAAITTNP